MTQEMLTEAALIANALKVKVSQVEAAVRLLDEGATVPFIARYRKEVTGSLDDTQLRFLQERLHYLRELEARREAVLESIGSQEKLTPQLEAAIRSAETKTQLEDLYLPFRPKRRTKAQIAREAGLEPLAELLRAGTDADPLVLAEGYLNPEAEVADARVALEGARQILMETFAEDATLVHTLREHLWQNGILEARGEEGTKSSAKKGAAGKFADYLNYSEPLHKIPSHRALALFRGRRENVLRFTLSLPQDPDFGVRMINAHFNIKDAGRPADAWMQETVRQCWKIKLFTKLELELLARLREAADEEAIRVFARNLRDLLLAAPAGAQTTLGLDPGIRTGVKAVVIDKTGKLLDYTTVFPFPPQNALQESITELARLCMRHNVQLISIGNGTGSRETERLVTELAKRYADLKLAKMVVSEAGASVYSASELAAQEFPDLDVTLRGAVSIARRLQDPLAELVKIEPKAIGVGQYQHDVNQSRLARSLEGVVEDCVNAVGVDVNTASVPLLARISGLNEGLARNLVEYRDTNGAFQNREQLRAVPRMGEKTFQQCAGFLRIREGDNPLDASAVHPEAYPVVEKILAACNVELRELMGNQSLLKSVNAEAFVDGELGLPTVMDVLRELEKPGRDPRPGFKTAVFREGVEDIKHLEVGMILEGVVSNVTNFGAFVDIGVHQDGLVHISALKNRYVNDPHAVVKAGEIVTVKVVEVDCERRRIGLSMRLEEEAPRAAVVRKTEKSESTRAKAASPVSAKPPRADKKSRAVQKPVVEKKKTVFNTAMADALARLKRGN